MIARSKVPRSGVAVTIAVGVGVATATLVPAASTAQSLPSVELGGDHDFLHGLLGEWTVVVAGEEVGTAVGRTRLNGQFVEVAIEAEAGPIQSALYTFGFDDRHGRFTVIAMDNTGTYWVTARGMRDGEVVPMVGEDDDPVMTEMGLDKEFVIELEIAGPDAARIETRFIDTRTPARTELPFLAFELRR